RAHQQGHAYQAPDLRLTWLAVIAFLPQFFVFYLPATREQVPDSLAAISLLISQTLLLAFAYFNRRLVGMWLLICGLALNLAVISANGGFMPISPQTATRLVPATIVRSIPIGSRFGKGKDVLLLPQGTRLEWLADRLLLPEWFPYQVAFSVGDLFVAAGAFWLLANQMPPQMKKEDISQ
ncbi:MAG: DUF5317 domain-containing protein, partial [Chloroflexi bacterium]|nr:DUF5317 domain-containing protein [Chloroflexota bacterium]